MPLAALAGYRAIFGAHATPTLLVYDRGGYATATLKGPGPRGGQTAGHPAQGQRAWHVAEDVRQTVRSERARPKGSLVP